MSKTQIGHMKLARYPELIESNEFNPIHWDVDPSTVCDHTCHGCPYIYDFEQYPNGDPMLGVVRLETVKSRRTFLDLAHFELFLKAARARGGKAITFVGGGEPTMHPYITELMLLASDYEFKFGMISHFGRKYGPEFYEALKKAVWLRVSVNAATPETYKRHQGRDHFDQAMANMHTFRQYVDAMGAKTRIGFSFLITNDNYTEIQHAAEIARLFGAHYIQYKPIIEVELGKSYEGLWAEIHARLLEAQPVGDGSFQILDQFSPRMEELKQHTQGVYAGKCHVPRFNPKLGANGTVYTCCELAYSKEGEIGNIYELSLDEILKRARAIHIDQGGCPHCWDKKLNTIINAGRLRDCTFPPESVDQEFV